MADTYAQIPASGSGDTVGPSSSTDNALVRFDATTGKLIQDSSAILSDTGTLSGITDLVTTGNIQCGGQIYSSLNAAGNSSTAKTISWADGNVQSVTLTGNCTFTFTNPIAGSGYVLILTQDATGTRTVTWPSAVKWPVSTAPTLTITANKVDIISLLYDGTYYYSNSVLLYL